MEPSSGASILIVDDTIENLRLLSSILEDRGYEVRPASSGRLALDAAASYPPDAILLDVNMPEMDGYEVCRRLKEVETLRDIPVIFLSAITETAGKLKGFSVGGADYVTKPFQVEEVLARVATHIALRQSRAQLQQSYEQLRVLERLRDDLVHMIVHDIRSPLGALILLLDHVQESSKDRLGPSAQESLQTAVSAANSLTRIANDMLDVSRLEESRLPLERENVDLVNVCRDVIEVLRPLQSTRQLELATSGGIEASCDRRLMQRVIENLVGNAIKHTQSTGLITIAVSRTGASKSTRVEVRDNGRGVPLDAREKIFDRYATLEARTESKYHSAGLGLTFCRMAVEAHGGRIGVEAAEPQGSVFWLELPSQPPT